MTGALLSLALLAAVPAPAVADAPAVAPDCDRGRLVREERRIPGGDPGIELWTLRVRASTSAPSRGAVVLMHGAGAGGSSIYDLRTLDLSFAGALACTGWDAWVLDVRGFGGSTLPPALLGPAEAAPPAVRADEAARDLEAVIDEARRVSGVARVDLFGWSWGCVVSGLVAGRRPDRIRRLVLYAPVYDRRNPKRHVTSGAWRPAVKAQIVKYFDPERESHAVWHEHLDAMFRWAPSGVLRLPSGPYRDIYGPEAPIWSAAKVTAPTLVVRGDRDKASLTAPVQRLFEALGSEERRLVVIGGGDHFLMRERRYGQLQRVVVEFLAADSLRAPPDPASRLGDGR